MGVKGGRETKKKLKIGICGEHGGDPDSVKFLHRTGLNYVSCSPFRIPVARLAAAQTALEEKGMARSEVSKLVITQKTSKPRSFPALERAGFLAR